MLFWGRNSEFGNVCNGRVPKLPRQQWRLFCTHFWLDTWVTPFSFARYRTGGGGHFTPPANLPHSPLRVLFDFCHLPIRHHVLLFAFGFLHFDFYPFGLFAIWLLSFLTYCNWLSGIWLLSLLTFGAWLLSILTFCFWLLTFWLLPFLTFCHLTFIAFDILHLTFYFWLLSFWLSTFDLLHFWLFASLTFCCFDFSLSTFCRFDFYPFWLLASWLLSFLTSCIWLFAFDFLSFDLVSFDFLSGHPSRGTTGGEQIRTLRLGPPGWMDWLSGTLDSSVEGKLSGPYMTVRSLACGSWVSEVLRHEEFTSNTESPDSRRYMTENKHIHIIHI